MSQDSKEWIKARMAMMRKQAGFAFNQDLFISILLCLISGRDKHLILTAPPERLSEVTQMASQISRGLFGFTTAKMSCQEAQTRADLVDTLFHTREESEANMERLNTSTSQIKNKQHESAIHSHRAGKSIQTLDSRTSERSQTSNYGQQTSGSSRNAGIKFLSPTETTDNNETHKTPVSPVDFNLRKRDKPSLVFSSRTVYNSSSSTPSSTAYANSLPQRDNKRSGTGDRSRWSDHEDMRRLQPTTSSTRLAQTLIMQGLDAANESIQALLLELIVTKELRISNVKYNVPKPFFLVIAVLPQGYNRLAISSQLMDRFFVSYNFEDEIFLHSPMPNPVIKQAIPRRAASMKQDEVKGLAEKSAKVHVNTDVTRYIRDIVVGIRTHPRVKGGITARCSQDLVTVTKSLAALFMRDYLTPDLVAIAAEKVFSHRLHVLALNTHDDQMEKEDMDANLPSNIVSEILRIIYVPV